MINMKQKNGEKHVFITLGFKLDNKGQLEPELIGRLKITLEAYKKYKNSYIIVSGGNPKNYITEAKAMSLWLLKHNVPQHKIIEENCSKDTLENAIYSMDIVNKINFASATLVTSDTHMKRAYFLFKKLDYYNKVSSTLAYHTRTNNNDYYKENELLKSNLEELNRRHSTRE